MPDRSREELVSWLADSFQWKERYADFEWHLEALSGGKRLAHVGLVRRTVRVGDREVDTALVGGVLTEASWRHRPRDSADGLGGLLRHADARASIRAPAVQ